MLLLGLFHICQIKRMYLLICKYKYIFLFDSWFSNIDVPLVFMCGETIFVALKLKLRDLCMKRRSSSPHISLLRLFVSLSLSL